MEQTSAEGIECKPGDTNPLCQSSVSNMRADIQVASAISIALQKSLELDVVPKSNGSFVSGGATLSVATNNPSGYAIYLQASKSEAGKASLVSTDLDNTAKIDPVIGTVTKEAFLDVANRNTWGYSLDGENYQAVPAELTNVKEVDTTSFDDRFTLDIGVAIDTTIPAGQYSNGIVVSAVANPMTLTSLSQLIYMQEMTPEICAATAGVEQDVAYKMNPVTKRLIDVRDGKKYWVAKLADGNCWMTQNLAYHVVAGKVLTPADTDVSADWSSTTSSSYSAPAINENPSQTELRSWGMQGNNSLLATPLKGQSCIAPGEVAESTNSVSSGKNLATELGNHCADVQNIANWEPSFTAQTGVWKGETTFVAASETTHTYDAHYLLGYYYQYGVATAGSGNSLSAGDAPSSICPKGWKLPSGRRNDNGLSLESDDSIAQLLAAYGYPSPGNVTGWSGLGSGGNGFYLIDYPGATRIDAAPFYFTRSGYINIPVGTLKRTGTGGYLWSQTANLDYAAYYTDLTDTSIYPTNFFGRYGGFPIRCVAR